MSDSAGTSTASVRTQPKRASGAAVAAVVIGRNEGERLKRCIRSVMDQVGRIVYVDSGSDDGSREWASEQGIEVIDLDTTVPFTMARARNAGWRHLVELDEGVELVQFLDGDCEVLPGWVELAVETLEATPTAAAVGGLRRERFPESTIYNRLTDLEWIRLPGEDVFFLGDVMIRLDLLRRTGGFNEGMIAGEEAELGLRFRDLGFRLKQLDAPMTLHDMGMTRFRQWWRRATRGGHAYAESAWLLGRSRHRHHVRDCLRAVVWGLGWPLFFVAGLAAGFTLGGWWWVAPGAAVAAAMFNIIRTTLRRHRTFGTAWGDALLYAVFCLLAKPAQLQGIFRFAWSLLRGRRPTLIEYRRVGG